MSTPRVAQFVALTFLLGSIANSSVSASESDLLWSRRYGGDTSSITGTSQWSIPTALQLDNDGFVIVGGTAFRDVHQPVVDIAIIKYNSAGEMVWARQWDGSGDRDDLRGLDIDQAGNVYATGFTSSDCVTLKYAPDGDLKWERRYDGVTHGYDWGNAITVSTLNDIYVAGGTSRGKSGNFYWLILKYDSLGTLTWQQNYGGHFEDGAHHLSITAGGGLYVGGNVYDVSTLADGSVRKFDTQGEPMWTKGFSSPGALRDSLVDLFVTSGQGVILVGKAFPYEKRTDSDIIIQSWDSSGSLLWVRHYGGEAELADIPAASLVDDAGNIYVTNLTESHPDSFDVLTLKLALDGKLIWKRVYASADGGFDSPCDMKLDSEGNVHVLAKCSNNTTLLTYSPEGELLAEIVPNFGEETYPSDGPVALVVDPHGYRYVLVQNQGDFVVGKFRPL